MLPIIPTPKSVKSNTEKTLYKATITQTENFRSASNAFCEYANRLGIKFTSASQGCFTVVTDHSLPSGAYRLTAAEDAVTLFVSDTAGANYAFATLLQIVEVTENAAECFVVSCEISDCADYGYRGVMVDLARNWHDFTYLLSYVDMCYFYKVTSLHLHFTDDQSYTLPSALFPKLSTEGRHYTFAQIDELTRYAHSRGVELIPEIDVPGHCVSFQQSYPEVFGANGIVCQHQKSIDAMQSLFEELCDMFPHSTYIHIGGDEAEIPNWGKCPECMEYAMNIGIDTSIKDKPLLAEHLYANFVSKMADAVFARGRTPIVWEGFAKEVNHLVSKEIIVMSWENYYQLTPDLIEAGFRIVNCSWEPTYIMAPDAVPPQRDVYAWTVYQWTPVHKQSPYYGTTLEIEPTNQVIGGQFHVWGDVIRFYPTDEECAFAERELLLERLPMLAENTWNNIKTLSFEDFMVKYEMMWAKLNSINCAI